MKISALKWKSLTRSMVCMLALLPPLGEYLEEHQNKQGALHSCPVAKGRLSLILPWNGVRIPSTA